MRTRLICLAVGIAAGPLFVPMAFADDPPRLDDLKFDAHRSSITAERVAIDSDGDGWVDWYERFAGSDPFDARSLPGAAILEVVDDRVIVQTIDVPDRLVIVDLATPEGLSDPQSAIPALVGLVQQLGKDTASGRALTTMTSELAAYGGLSADPLVIAGQAGKESSAADDLGPRVGGVKIGLISSVSVGVNSAGSLTLTVQTFVELRQGPATHTLTYTYSPTTGDVFRDSQLIFANSIGGVDTVERLTLNGKQMFWVRKQFDDKGRLVSTQYFDEKGDALGPPAGSAPASSVAPATTAAGSATTVDVADTTPDVSTAESTATTVGDFVDPNYEQPRLPTEKEIADRAEFLKGISGRFGTTFELPERPKDDPGVADPAEPECRGQFCVVFTVVEAPNLNSTAGGDPINPEFGPHAPPITTR